jgi:hypothetical protein
VPNLAVACIIRAYIEELGETQEEWTVPEGAQWRHWAAREKCVTLSCAGNLSVRYEPVSRHWFETHPEEESLDHIFASAAEIDQFNTIDSDDLGDD